VALLLTSSKPSGWSERRPSMAASHRARAAMLGEGVSVLEPSMSRDNAKGRAVFG
jgi:hypothetical protein